MHSLLLLLSWLLLASSEQGSEMEMADQGMDEVLDPVFFIKLIPDTKRSKVGLK